MSSWSQNEVDLAEVKQINFMSGYSIRYRSSSREQIFRKNLRKFLANPPRESITSLKLTGLKQLESMATLSPEDTQVWTSFIMFWYPKLRCLEVDFFDNFFYPNKSFVHQLLTLPLLSRFVCSEINEKKQTSSDSSSSEAAELSPKEFPQRLFYIPKLKIGSFFFIKVETYLQFYERLAKNSQLETYETGADYYYNNEDFITPLFQAITKFIQQSVVKELRLNMFYHFNKWHDKNPNFGEVVAEFGAAVAGSSAKISISGLIGKKMYDHIKESLDGQSLSIFNKCVEWTEQLPISALDQFPNIKIVERVTETAAVSYPVFPDHLERLRMSCGRFPLNYPSSLTHLQITQVASTCSEMMIALMTLSHGCTQLKDLELDWTLYDGLYLEEMFSNPRFQSTKPFPSNFNYTETNASLMPLQEL